MPLSTFYCLCNGFHLLICNSPLKSCFWPCDGGSAEVVALSLVLKIKQICELRQCLSVWSQSKFLAYFFVFVCLFVFPMEWEGLLYHCKSWIYNLSWEKAIRKNFWMLCQFFWNLPVYPMLGLFVPNIHHIIIFNAFS